MCLAVPALITEVNEGVATVELGGVSRQASLMLLPGAAVGDYILIHAGFAISLVDEKEAAETLAVFSDLATAIDEADDPEAGWSGPSPGGLAS